MISALFYLQFNSVKNRLTLRFKRLKQPKYLFGAIVGGLYFYWYFGRVLLDRRGGIGYIKDCKSVRGGADNGGEFARSINRNHAPRSSNSSCYSSMPNPNATI